MSNVPPDNRFSPADRAATRLGRRRTGRPTVSNVPADNRFSPADRAALARRLCEVLAMEDGDEIPLVHRDAHVRSAAGAIGCGFDELRTSEQDELAGLCDQFATTARGELCAGVLGEDPDKAGTIVTVDGVNDLAAVATALDHLNAMTGGRVAAALYRHPAGGRFAPDLR